MSYYPYAIHLSDEGEKILDYKVGPSIAVLDNNLSSTNRWMKTIISFVF